MEVAKKQFQKMEARKGAKKAKKAERREQEAAAAAAKAAHPRFKENPLSSVKAKENPFDSPKELNSKFHVSDIKGVDFLGSFLEDESTWPRTTVPEIAFLGRSNVGKSSLLNCLFGEKVAKVSKTPGRTQQINLFSAKTNTGKDACWFADLPGYGYAKIGKEDQRGIEASLMKYLNNRSNLRLLVLLVDSRREPLEMDESILAFAAGAEVTFQVLVVATKVDKLKPMEALINIKRIQDGFGLPSDFPIPFSIVTGEGRGQVWQYIREACLGN
ncbi:unnamed protein product [Chrysoparadoxa australica]